METVRHHGPWNKGKLIGQKPPLKQKDIWAIRIHLQLNKRVRELAMFNLAIDSKLRGCPRAFGADRHLGKASDAVDSRSWVSRVDENRGW